MPFGRPESLLTMPVLLLLPASPLSCVHSKRMCSQHQLISPTSARRVSLRAAVSCICRVLYQQELLQTVIYLTQHCPSACPHPMSRLSKVLLLIVFLCDCIALTANRDLCNRGLLARGSKQVELLPWLGNGAFVSQAVN